MTARRAIMKLREDLHVWAASHRASSTTRARLLAHEPEPVVAPRRRSEDAA
jgi:hypothetical protein